MENLVSIFCFSIIIVGTYSSSIAQPTKEQKPFDSAWFNQPRWNEGKAEVLFYKTSEGKYGVARKSTATWIVVKEDHLPDVYVKADQSKPGTIPVIKFIQSLDIPTGIYRYHQTFVSFVRQDNLEVPKSTFSSQEWCGLTFKELLLTPSKATLSFNSYWEADGKGPLNFKLTQPALPYNDLPLFLRSLKPGTKELKLNLFEDLISNKVGKPKIEEAQVLVESKDEHVMQATVIHSKGTDTYWIGKNSPNFVTSWKKWDGSVYELVSSKWIDYWKYNQVQDEHLQFPSPYVLDIPSAPKNKVR